MCLIIQHWLALVSNRIIGQYPDGIWNVANVHMMYFFINLKMPYACYCQCALVMNGIFLRFIYPTSWSLRDLLKYCSAPRYRMKFCSILLYNSLMWFPQTIIPHAARPPLSWPVWLCSSLVPVGPVHTSLPPPFTATFGDKLSLVGQ